MRFSTLDSYQNLANPICFLSVDVLAQGYPLMPLSMTDTTVVALGENSLKDITSLIESVCS